jgi:hypothetical protein
LKYLLQQPQMALKLVTPRRVSQIFTISKHFLSLLIYKEFC